MAKGEVWIAGVSHCIGCGCTEVHVAPAPLGLAPDMECGQCSENLCVFDDADILLAHLKGIS